MIRTRFAPSPTGYLHIGGARTALYCWAFAKRHGGKFILRIEDTDLERSTQQSVQAILDAMQWLGLDYDEGPFYQMKRLERYKAVGEQLLAKGLAYWDYCTKEELDAMREAQVARGEKPRYDRRWRDSKETPPPGRQPALRFKNPLAGDVTWNDLVKGSITVSNEELDDLVLLRADGIPTYNFGVVVDDIDMAMTHVIRGDDHVNNTPRQINLYAALGADIPRFAHVPMILGPDGQRLSKRHGAVSVTQYRDEGYLPEAMVNYLARLGWSHGDEEIFSREQLVEWFDLEHVSKSPARWDPEKLKWLNGEYLKRLSAGDLIDHLRKKNEHLFLEISERMDPVAQTTIGMGSWQTLVSYETYMHELATPRTDPEARAQYLAPGNLEMLKKLVPVLNDLPWERAVISQALKEFAKGEGLKMPEVMMPLRVALTGRAQSKSIDAITAALKKPEALRRIQAAIQG